MPTPPGGNDPPPTATQPDAGPHPTPLAIILSVMRDRYDAKDYEAAIALAKLAAPYLHPRASAAAPLPNLATLHDADLEQLSPPD